MQLKKLLLRYYPPGIILQYSKDGVLKQKPVDLLDVTPDTDVEVTQKLYRSSDCRIASCSNINHTRCFHALEQVLLAQILNQEPLISDNKKPVLRQLIQRLIAKLTEPQYSQFDVTKVVV
jgi:dynein assembly factor with WDR repeat domains 1